MRNDGILYSGQAANVQAIKERHQVIAKAKQETRGKLLPAYDVVRDEVEAEKTRIMKDLSQLVMSIDTREKDVKAYLLALQMNLDFLNRFSNSMQNKLRVKDNG